MVQRGSTWRNPSPTGYNSFSVPDFEYEFCFSCGFPADGLALVIQNDPAGTGSLGYTGNGQNLAYGNNDVSTGQRPRKCD